MQKRSKKWVPFVVALAIGFVLSLAFAAMRGIGGAQTPAESAHKLSDGFFVVGVLMTGIGGLVAISTASDFFDLLAYGFRSALLFIAPIRREMEKKSFYDYKLERQEKRQGGSVWFLLAAGLVLLAFAGVCTALFYCWME